MRRALLLWGLLCLPLQFAHSQNASSATIAPTSPAKPYPYKARTVNEEVQVFEKPDFDSKVIATLDEGHVFDVSSQLYGGAFYRIRLQPGLLGYVSDADVKPLWKSGVKASVGGVEKPLSKAEEKKQKAKQAHKRKPDQPEKKNRSFEYTQYVGLQYASIEYQEETMGDRRREPGSFFGVKLAGPDLVVDGAFPTEINFLFRNGAPGYYERLTGKGADGWIFLMDFLFESYFPQGRNALLFLGFGPMFRYSKFNVSLTDNTTNKTQDYSLEDMAVGAVFNAGAAVRLSQKVALRGELQYYWEKQPYWGAGAAFQFAF
jgi:hypothetical protein